MKICILDAATLGDDISFENFFELGDVRIYPSTSYDEAKERLDDCDVAVVNKVKLNEGNLCGAKNLKLVCITATGFDNVDIDYCRSRGIGVCNVIGYSSDSVAQLTVSMVLSLINKLSVYDSFVKSGKYTESGVHNRLTPVYHEIRWMNWGIVGYGGIGKQVARAASAFGCNVFVFKKNPSADANCVPLGKLMSESDIVTIHLPLNDETRNIIDSNMISLLKRNAVIVNTARGAVWDEHAVAQAVLDGRIGAMGTDVYSSEPMGADHPFAALAHCDNVCLTPHMAWGAYEARVRCMDEIILNIKSFFDGEMRCRVDVCCN